METHSVLHCLRVHVGLHSWSCSRAKVSPWQYRFWLVVEGVKWTAERMSATRVLLLHFTNKKNSLLISQNGWQWSPGWDAQPTPKPKFLLQSITYRLSSQPVLTLARQETAQAYSSFGSARNGSDPCCYSLRMHHLHPRATAAHSRAVSGCVFLPEETSAGEDRLSNLCLQKDVIAPRFWVLHCILWLSKYDLNWLYNISALIPWEELGHVCRLGRL